MPSWALLKFHCRKPTIDDTPPPSVKGNRRRPLASVFRIYQSGKKVVFSKTRLGYERTKQFFMLPGCYRQV